MGDFRAETPCVIFFLERCEIHYPCTLGLAADIFETTMRSRLPLSYKILRSTQLFRPDLSSLSTRACFRACHIGPSELPFFAQPHEMPGDHVSSTYTKHIHQETFRHHHNNRESSYRLRMRTPILLPWAIDSSRRDPAAKARRKNPLPAHAR